MTPRSLLRLEGLVLFAAATGAYFARGGSLVLFVLVFLVPDLSMIGYAVDERWGSRVYNAGHTYLLPGLLLGAGLLLPASLAVSLALVWFAHVGGDRVLGYGLKYETGFGDTHLSRA
ncbi:MAG: DUF4260 family protein [Haloarculaceae archaeon]